MSRPNLSFLIFVAFAASFLVFEFIHFFSPVLAAVLIFVAIWIILPLLLFPAKRASR